ncbi:Cysteine-rich receptor-like protein kinase 25 [Cinnamomum micranthum f. kanehirae]|uniref:Cysteine-rich receptor-like protein kinase 25 n=1 Tax=Cinnamomum micranthum f. kanehirae TaxID=337451 RepID=A0A443PJE3_9MAGN|nr:Cysteine-rich receptor-like protein kinase 25 [Cinnamomum micranthum f. kanehirae]
MKIFSISLPIFFSLFLMLILFYIPTITAESPPARCDNASTFHTNLEILLSSLPWNTSLHNGFYTNTVGQDPDKAYGLALCRGDATPDMCYGCIETAVGEILSQQCPDISSTKWDVHCMIRYSLINFLGSSRTQTWDYVPNPNNATNPAQLEKILGNLMNNLSTRAAFEPRTGMFATGEANLSSPSTLYGLVQCIRDITPGDCYSCLGDAISQLPKCCVNKEGGRVRGPVCIIWFEISSYSFYGASTIEVPAPSPAPAPAPAPSAAPSTDETTRGRDHNLSRIVIILIPAIVIPIIFLVIVTLLRIMKKKTSLRKKKTSTSAMDQLDGSDVLLQIDFEMIRVATNDFSDENKLGEGGFGPVYKLKADLTSMLLLLFGTTCLYLTIKQA